MPDASLASMLPPGDQARILLVRPSALGDVCRTVPALVSLRQAFPQARIDWLVEEAYAPAVASHPALSGVVVFPKKHFAAWKRPAVLGRLHHWLGQIRRTRYHLAVDLQGLLRSGLISRASSAPHRLGFANARELAFLCYNRRYHIDAQMHTVERMLALLAAAGLPTSSDMQLYTSPGDEQWLERFRSEQGLTQDYVCLAPTAKWLCKRWPLDRYLAIGRRLLETGQAGAKVVVLAAPDERAYIQPLLADLGPRAVFPSTTVGQLMTLIRHCRILLCNDSAPLHMAVGFSRPLVTIFGPTDPALVGPYRRGDCVVRPASLEGRPVPRSYRHQGNDQSLIAQVDVEAVWQRAIQQLQRERPVNQPHQEGGAL